VLLAFLKITTPKRFNLNISSPNIYVFAYEAQAHHLWSFYHLIFLLFKFIASSLFSLTLIFLFQKQIHFSIDIWYMIKFLSVAWMLFFIAKYLIEILYVIIIKKHKFMHKLRFIRQSYENYFFFYLFIFSFLSFYFPVKNFWIVGIIITISTLWTLLVWYNIYNNIHKHIDIKSYQIFLYLCLSEILPFIVIIGWIIFQIL